MLKNSIKWILKNKYVLYCLMFWTLIFAGWNIVYALSRIINMQHGEGKLTVRSHKYVFERIVFEKYRHGIHKLNTTENMCKSGKLSSDLVEGDYGNLVTLFTTFRETPDKLTIYNNTIHNWASLIPDVQPVLFTNTPDGNLETVAQKLGWTILTVPRQNKHGTPILKDMFLHFQKGEHFYASAFYGFSNGDILFDKGLLTNLKVIDEFFRIKKKCLMVVGQRKNILMTENQLLYNPEDITREADQIENTFGTGAEDYFFFPRNLFPWYLLPDLVIGRPGYDNFMVIFSKLVGVDVFDVTRTCVALHQTGYDGNKAGSKAMDSSYNTKLIDQTYKGLVVSRFGDTDMSRYYFARHHLYSWKFRIRVRQLLDYVEKDNLKPL